MAIRLRTESGIDFLENDNFPGKITIAKDSTTIWGADRDTARILQPIGAIRVYTRDADFANNFAFQSSVSVGFGTFPLTEVMLVPSTDYPNGGGGLFFWLGSGSTATYSIEMRETPDAVNFIPVTNTNTVFMVNTTTQALRIDQTNYRVLVNTASTVPAAATSTPLQILSQSTNPCIALYVAAPSNSNFYNVAWFSTPFGGGGTLATRGSPQEIATFSTSDVRNKTDIRDFTAPFSILNQLRPVRFHWLGSESDAKSWGFIAHEVQQVIPDAVSAQRDAVDAEGRPDYQMLDLAELLPVAVACANSLRQELLDLQAEIDMIKGAQ